MKLKNFMKDFGYLVVALVMLLALVGIWKSQSTTTKAYQDNREALYSRVRDGVGTEVPLADTASETQIANSVASLERFMNYRAGIEMSDSNKQLLMRLEKMSISSPDKGMTPAEVAETLSSIILARLSRSTDQQIVDYANTMAGLDHPDLPEEFKNDRLVRLRGSIITGYTPQAFSEEVKKVARDTNNPLYRTTVNTFINQQMQKTLDYTAPAGVKLTNSARKLSPVKAYLLAYAFITNDHLCDSGSNISKQMWSTHYSFSQKLGIYPSPQGLRPFGKNGYITSMPTEFFDEAAQTQLLKDISKKVY